MTEPITIEFPGGLKVNAKVGEHLIQTDQPLDEEGEGSAPSPYDLFLSSLATCAGYYVLAFCRTRNISTEGIKIVQKAQRNSLGKLESISIEIEVPTDFPPKYVPVLERAAHSCSVKRTILDPPEFKVQARQTQSS